MLGHARPCAGHPRLAFLRSTAATTWGDEPGHDGALRESQLPNRIQMTLRGLLGEAAEYDPTERARVLQFGCDRLYRDARGAAGRKTIDAGRDRRKGDRGEPMFGRDL